jgi:hypothetical protein
VVISLTFSTASYASTGPQLPRSVVFLLYDAGETLAVNPVIRRLRQSGVPVHVVAWGTAHRMLQHDCAPKIDIDPDLRLYPKNIEVFDRDLELSAANVKPIVEKLVRSNPALVITGNVSVAQYQLATSLSRSGSKVVTYHDSFSRTEHTHLRNRFLNFDEYWVPSDELLNDIVQSSPKAKIVTVGHPTLDLWQSTGIQEMRLSTLDTLGELELNRPVVLFVGGYGPHYEESLRLFYEAASNQIAKTKYLFLLSPHPKTDGSVERELLATFSNAAVKITPPALDTRNIASVATVVVSQMSTFNIQAMASAGLPGIYLRSNAVVHEDIATRAGLIPVIHNAGDFINELNRSIAIPSDRYKDFHTMLRIPPNGTDLMVERIFNILK